MTPKKHLIQGIKENLNKVLEFLGEAEKNDDSITEERQEELIKLLAFSSTDIIRLNRSEEIPGENTPQEEKPESEKAKAKKLVINELLDLLYYFNDYATLNVELCEQLETSLGELTIPFEYEYQKRFFNRNQMALRQGIVIMQRIIIEIATKLENGEEFDVNTFDFYRYPKEK